MLRLSLMVIFGQVSPPSSGVLTHPTRHFVPCGVSQFILIGLFGSKHRQVVMLAFEEIKWGTDTTLPIEDT